MDNLNDLKAIWLTAKTDDLPASDEMLQMVKSFKEKKLRSKRKLIIVSTVVIVFWIVFIWFMSPVMLITWIGTVLIVLSSAVVIWTNARSMKRFYELDECSNKEFLAFLEQTRRNQLYYHTKTQVLGLSLNSVGLFLYLYEFVRYNTVVLIVSYAVTVIVMLITWLYIRPKSFKEQSAKLNATIAKLEKISNQIN